MWLNINFSNPINALHKNMYLLIDIRNVNWTPGHHAHHFKDSNGLHLMTLQVNGVKILSGPQFDNLERWKYSCLQKYLCKYLEIAYVADTHQHDLNRWESFQKWPP